MGFPVARVREALADGAGGDAGDDGVGLDVLRDDGTGGDDGSAADAGSGHDREPLTILGEVGLAVHVGKPKD